ncbi:hypothetical protein IJ472_01880 [bacterium]|nr:hypothetical protein [bacterium]
MTRIIAFTGAEQRPLTREERVERRENVATGVGGAAGLTASASKMASRKVVKAKTGEQVLQGMMTQVTNTTKAVNQNTKVATGLWARFKSDITMYTKDILKRLEGLKTNKYIARLIESPLTKKAAGVFGAGLAFFVLVTGVNKAFKTGTVAVGDLKAKLQDINA